MISTIDSKAIRNFAPKQTAPPSATESETKNENPSKDSTETPTKDSKLPEVKLKTPRFLFRETHLFSHKGMGLLYEEVSKRKLNYRSGKEAEDMQHLASIYQQWAKQLNPRAGALETLDKISDWSGKMVVKNVMSRMRDELEIPRAQNERNMKRARTSDPANDTEDTSKPAEVISVQKRFAEITEVAREFAEKELERRRANDKSSKNTSFANRPRADRVNSKTDEVSGDESVSGSEDNELNDEHQLSDNELL